MDKPKILCYNISPDILSKLSRLALRFGASVTDIKPEGYGLPLVSAASGVKAQPNPLASRALPEGMLVFVSFPETALSVFLDALKAKEIRISLKAILTPHNATWDAHTLYKELCKERAELRNK